MRSYLSKYMDMNIKLRIHKLIQLYINIHTYLYFRAYNNELDYA